MAATIPATNKWLLTKQASVAQSTGRRQEERAWRQRQGDHRQRGGGRIALATSRPGSLLRGMAEEAWSTPGDEGKQRWRKAEGTNEAGAGYVQMHEWIRCLGMLELCLTVTLCRLRQIQVRVVHLGDPTLPDAEGHSWIFHVRQTSPPCL